MDFINKKFFSCLTYNRHLERLHKEYKTCIADKIENYMKTGDFPDVEICTTEKDSYYLKLHDLNKIEHDSIRLFAAERIGRPYNYN